MKPDPEVERALLAALVNQHTNRLRKGGREATPRNLGFFPAAFVQAAVKYAVDSNKLNPEMMAIAKSWLERQLEEA